MSRVRNMEGAERMRNENENDFGPRENEAVDGGVGFFHDRLRVAENRVVVDKFAEGAFAFGEFVGDGAEIGDGALEVGGGFLIEDEGAEEIGALPCGPGSIAFVGNALPGGGLNGFGLLGSKPHGPGFEMVGSRVAEFLRLLDGHEPLRAHGWWAE